MSLSYLQSLMLLVIYLIGKSIRYNKDSFNYFYTILSIDYFYIIS